MNIFQEQLNSLETAADLLENELYVDLFCFIFSKHPGILIKGENEIRKTFLSITF